MVLNPSTVKQSIKGITQQDLYSMLKHDAQFKRSFAESLVKTAHTSGGWRGLNISKALGIDKKAKEYNTITGKVGRFFKRLSGMSKEDIFQQDTRRTENYINQLLERNPTELIEKFKKLGEERQEVNAEFFQTEAAQKIASYVEQKKKLAEETANIFNGLEDNIKKQITQRMKINTDDLQTEFSHNDHLVKLGALLQKLNPEAYNKLKQSVADSNNSTLNIVFNENVKTHAMLDTIDQNAFQNITKFVSLNNFSNEINRLKSEYTQAKDSNNLEHIKRIVLQLQKIVKPKLGDTVELNFEEMPNEGELDTYFTNMPAKVEKIKPILEASNVYLNQLNDIVSKMDVIKKKELITDNDRAWLEQYTRQLNEIVNAIKQEVVVKKPELKQHPIYKLWDTSFKEISDDFYMRDSQQLPIINPQALDEVKANIPNELNSIKDKIAEKLAGKELPEINNHIKVLSEMVDKLPENADDMEVALKAFAEAKQILNKSPGTKQLFSSIINEKLFQPVVTLIKNKQIELKDELSKKFGLDFNDTFVPDTQLWELKLMEIFERNNEAYPNNAQDIFSAIGKDNFEEITKDLKAETKNEILALKPIVKSLEKTVFESQIENITDQKIEKDLLPELTKKVVNQLMPIFKEKAMENSYKEVISAVQNLPNELKQYFDNEGKTLLVNKILKDAEILKALQTPAATKDAQKLKLASRIKEILISTEITTKDDKINKEILKMQKGMIPAVLEQTYKEHLKSYFDITPKELTDKIEEFVTKNKDKLSPQKLADHKATIVKKAEERAKDYLTQGIRDDVFSSLQDIVGNTINLNEKLNEVFSNKIKNIKLNKNFTNAMAAIREAKAFKTTGLSNELKTSVESIVNQMKQGNSLVIADMKNLFKQVTGLEKIVKTYNDNYKEFAPIFNSVKGAAVLSFLETLESQPNELGIQQNKVDTKEQALFDKLDNIFGQEKAKEYKKELIGHRILRFAQQNNDWMDKFGYKDNSEEFKVIFTPFIKATKEGREYVDKVAKKLNYSLPALNAIPDIKIEDTYKNQLQILRSFVEPNKRKDLEFNIAAELGNATKMDEAITNINEAIENVDLLINKPKAKGKVAKQIATIVVGNIIGAFLGIDNLGIYTDIALDDFGEEKEEKINEFQEKLKDNRDKLVEMRDNYTKYAEDPLAINVWLPQFKFKVENDEKTLAEHLKTAYPEIITDENAPAILLDIQSALSAKITKPSAQKIAKELELNADNFKDKIIPEWLFNLPSFQVALKQWALIQPNVTFENVDEAIKSLKGKKTTDMKIPKTKEKLDKAPTNQELIDILTKKSSHIEMIKLAELFENKISIKNTVGKVNLKTLENFHNLELDELSALFTAIQPSNVGEAANVFRGAYHTVKKKQVSYIEEKFEKHIKSLELKGGPKEINKRLEKEKAYLLSIKPLLTEDMQKKIANKLVSLALATNYPLEALVGVGSLFNSLSTAGFDKLEVDWGSHDSQLTKLKNKNINADKIVAKLTELNHPAKSLLEVFNSKLKT